MTSRRAFPAQMISDNGTNFLGAAREQRELVNVLDKTKIRELIVNGGGGGGEWFVDSTRRQHHTSMACMKYLLKQPSEQCFMY